MQNFYKLDIPVPVLRNTVDLNSYPEFADFHWAVWNDKSEKYMTPESIDFIHSMGIKDQVWFNDKMQPDHVVIFRGNKGQFMDIHCDRGPVWCINLAWGCSKSEMVWYQPHVNTELTTEMCSVGSPYEKYDPAQCDVLERTFEVGPMLTRIDTPHNVINYDNDNYRWCLSIRDLSNTMSWEEAVEHFKPWFSPT